MQLHLNSYGADLMVKDGVFEIHYQLDGKAKKHHVAIHKVTSIWLRPETTISGVAIQAAMNNGVDVIFVDKFGQPYSRIWHNRPYSTPEIQRAQLQLLEHKDGGKWVVDWIAEKLTTRIEFLERLRTYQKTKVEGWQGLLDTQKEAVEKLKALRHLKLSKSADRIRGLEGSAGKQYFKAISKSIPRKWRFKSRSMLPAKDPFNTLLLYGYGILYSHVEKAIISAGLNPYFGLLHRDGFQQKSFVYDFIEPYRILVERAVYAIFSGKHYNNSCIEQTANGLMLTAAGKKTLTKAINNVLFEETAEFREKREKRSRIIFLRAQHFANCLISQTNTV